MDDSCLGLKKQKEDGNQNSHEILWKQPRNFMSWAKLKIYIVTERYKPKSIARLYDPIVKCYLYVCSLDMLIIILSAQNNNKFLGQYSGFWVIEDQKDISIITIFGYDALLIILNGIIDNSLKSILDVLHLLVLIYYSFQ